MSDILINVISSEKTWRNLARFGFEQQLKTNRSRFHLAITFNGYCGEAVEYYGKFNPEYLFVRSNLGFDPAAVEHFLQLIPVYNTTILLHDDHWFLQEDWLSQIVALRTQYPETDIWGNIVLGSTNPKYYNFCKSLGLPELMELNPHDNGLLQGLAGIFSANAIQKLKTVTFNFPKNFDKEIAFLGELVFSSATEHLKLLRDQIPGGVFGFLMHQATSHRDRFIWEGNNAYHRGESEKALGNYYKYMEMCEADNYVDGMLLACFSIASISFSLGQYDTTLEYCKKSYAIDPNFRPMLEFMQQFQQSGMGT